MNAGIETAETQAGEVEAREVEAREVEAREVEAREVEPGEVELADPKLARRRERAELRREQRAAREAEARRRRAERSAERRATRQDRAGRRAERVAAVAELGRRLRPVAPLLLVTGFAMYAQYDYGLGAYTSPSTGWPVKVLVAVGTAVAVESIANYVQWHAHDALLLGATATAARLRRASYLIAFGVAAVNYSHFSAGWSPTPAAVVFALFSAAQPWLWGLHTRRAQRIQLIREGQVDSTGAVFSVERWRAFPLRTWMARRWSIDHGVTDPRAAWEGYHAERAAAPQQNAAHQQEQLASAVTHDVPPADGLTGQLQAAYRDGQLNERGLALASEQAPPARDRAAELIADGAGRRRLSRELGISEHQARQLLDRTRTTNDTSPADTSAADTSAADTSAADNANTTCQQHTSTARTSTDHDVAPDWVPALNGSELNGSELSGSGRGTS